jgi:SAM-dependent methyltransferase
MGPQHRFARSFNRTENQRRDERWETGLSAAKKNTKRALIAIYRTLTRLFGSFADCKYLDPQVPISKLNHLQYLANIGNRKGIRILEIGSREVTGKSDARERFSNAEYVGFDFHPGPNVDVVGDAHRLSQYFGGQRFDIIFSIAVFEHLAMPWVVATEIAKLLKPGGIILVKTHFSYSSHERPWHFFQFSDMALRVLFSPALGFECIEAGASNPVVGRFSALAEQGLRFTPVTGLYCGSEFLGRKIKDVDHFDWNDAKLGEVVGGTEYPPPQL